MNNSENNRGIKLVPVGDLTAEAKNKLNALMERKKESLDKLVDAYKSGRLTAQQ